MKRKIVIMISVLAVLLILGVFFRVDYWLTKPKYMSDPEYCEQDSDCVVDGNNCRAVNKYNFKESRHVCMLETCGAFCENNQCRLKTDCG